MKPPTEWQLWADNGKNHDAALDYLHKNPSIARGAPDGVAAIERIFSSIRPKKPGEKYLNGSVDLIGYAFSLLIAVPLLWGFAGIFGEVNGTVPIFLVGIMFGLPSIIVVKLSQSRNVTVAILVGLAMSIFGLYTWYSSTYAFGFTKFSTSGSIQIGIDVEIDVLTFSLPGWIGFVLDLFDLILALFIPAALLYADTQTPHCPRHRREMKKIRYVAFNPEAMRRITKAANGNARGTAAALASVGQAKKPAYLVVNFCPKCKNAYVQWEQPTDGAPHFFPIGFYSGEQTKELVSALYLIKSA